MLQSELEGCRVADSTANTTFLTVKGFQKSLVWLVLVVSQAHLVPGLGSALTGCPSCCARV